MCNNIVCNNIVCNNTCATTECATTVCATTHVQQQSVQQHRVQQHRMQQHRVQQHMCNNRVCNNIVLHKYRVQQHRVQQHCVHQHVDFTVNLVKKADILSKKQDHGKRWYFSPESSNVDIYGMITRLTQLVTYKADCLLVFSSSSLANSMKLIDDSLMLLVLSTSWLSRRAQSFFDPPHWL